MPEASDRPLSDDAIDESRENEGSEASGASEAPRRSEGGDGGLAERPRDALRGASDEDLVFERTDGEIGALQWLQALDLQFLGACRADERLKPLLKLNVSSGAKEDRLISQLSQVCSSNPRSATYFVGNSEFLTIHLLMLSYLLAAF